MSHHVCSCCFSVSGFGLSSPGLIVPMKLSLCAPNGVHVVGGGDFLTYVSSPGNQCFFISGISCSKFQMNFDFLSFSVHSVLLLKVEI